MGNEIKMQLPSDTNKINTNNLGEFIWWCAHLGIGPEKLLHIIEQAGESVEKIRAFLSVKENGNYLFTRNKKLEQPL